MSNSRAAILQRVRQYQPPEEPLPELDNDWVQYEDVKATFIDSLAAVGGRAIELDAVEAQSNEIEKLIKDLRANSVCTLIGGLDVSSSDVTVRDLPSCDTPHELHDVDLAILPSRFGVAENGAVWLQEPQLKHRVLPFLTQHLAFTLHVDQILHNMHQAYERVTFDDPVFGTFISGPSKTADIEQSLVIGAHGARSLTILLLP